MTSVRFGFLLWTVFIHLVGIYLFTRGFLLTRLSLSNLSDHESLQGVATHSRAVLLIIDALRFDFITPDPPSPPSPVHHNILTLPRELTATRPRNSFIFNSYADPPTATLQRIKGITTGSLPTFVDIGNNFGGSSIAEDSIIKQLKMAGKRLAFMGDDTWMSVFPDSFDRNMTFPYDSFNVEDLHTVDEGVIRHLFPLLEDPSKPFDFLVGHFLGVDHVGHRVGPDHPSMKSKLQQMNDVLTKVVDALDDDTLLVVLGDHGMDRSGDHGGDGTHETSSALWVYSKDKPLIGSGSVPSGLLKYRTFPETTVPHRGIQQIDIVPTLSLLLGIPIPYNNLGTVIPEFFWRGSVLFDWALDVNAKQIMTYLQTYRSSPSGGELDDAWNDLQNAFSVEGSGERRWISLVNFNRVALSSCRAIWAQFNPILMAFGLLSLGMSFCASWCIYSGYFQVQGDRDSWLWIRLRTAIMMAFGEAVVGPVAHIALNSYLPGISSWQCYFFAASITSSIHFIINTPPKFDISGFPIILTLHSIAFFSNSFTFWEDRIVPFMLVTAIVPYALTGFAAPNIRLRYRIIGFSAIFAICVRLMAISTVCREEQQPYCHVTFFASSSLPSPPFPVLLLALPTALALPFALQRFLQITRSELGLSRTFFPLILLPTLLGGTLFWLIEFADSASILGESASISLRTGRTWLARFSFGWISLAGGALWYLVPLCLDLKVDESGGKKQIKVLGFANAFGAPYLIFWSITLGIVFVASQLTAQIVLALSAIALVSYLEVLDSVRDVQTMQAAFTSTTPSAILDPTASAAHTPSLKFKDIVPIALLGLHTFYATGHQSTISSIQWKAAFMLSPTVTYPFSPLTVVVNSIGPIFLFAVGVPLVALWNRAPVTPARAAPAPITEEEKTGDEKAGAETSGGDEDPAARVKAESTLAGLGLMIYYSALLLGAAVSAAILRRHLMVWKVFAPRFMTAVLELLAVDVGVLVGVGLGVERIAGRVVAMFKIAPR